MGEGEGGGPVVRRRAPLHIGERLGEAARRGAQAVRVVSTAEAVSVYQPLLTAVENYRGASRWMPPAEARRAIADAIEHGAPPEEIAHGLGRRVDAVRASLIEHVMNGRPLLTYTKEEQLWLFRTVFDHLDGVIASEGPGQIARDRVAQAAMGLFDDIISVTRAGSAEVSNVLSGLRVLGGIGDATLARFSYVLGSVSASELSAIVTTHLGAGGSADAHFFERLVDPNRSGDIAALAEELAKPDAEVERVARRLADLLRQAPSDRAALDNLLRSIERTHPDAYAALNERVGHLFDIAKQAARETTDAARARALASLESAVGRELGDEAVKEIATPANARKCVEAIRRLLTEKPALERLINFSRQFAVETEPAWRTLRASLQRLPAHEAIREYFGFARGARGGAVEFGVGVATPARWTWAALKKVGESFAKNPRRWGAAIGLLLAGGAIAYAVFSDDEESKKGAPRTVKGAVPVPQQRPLSAADQAKEAQAAAKKVEEEQKKREEQQQIVAYLRGKTRLPIDELPFSQRQFLESHPSVWRYFDEEKWKGGVPDLEAVTAGIDAFIEEDRAQNGAISQALERVFPLALEKPKGAVDLGGVKPRPEVIPPPATPVKEWLVREGLVGVTRAEPKPKARSPRRPASRRRDTSADEGMADIQ